MQVQVLNRERFKLLLISKYGNFMDIHKDNHNCYISISNNDEDIIYPDGPNYLNLCFDDITDQETAWKDETLFDVVDAYRIIQFMESNKEVDTVYVHCAAGISRSASVGLFINDVWAKQPYSTLEWKSWVHPNPHVSRVLNMVYRFTINIDTGRR